MIDNSMDITIDNDSDPSIMTGDNQPLTRIIGKPKLDKDPNALKIASFRTKEGVWAEFSSKADLDGLTATDVLKAAMEQYLSGEYNPRVITVRHHELTREDVLDIVNTAISTLSLPTEERVNNLISMAVNTSISTEMINSTIMTTVSTLSLQTDSDVNTLVSTALVPIEAEISKLKKPHAIG